MRPAPLYLYAILSEAPPRPGLGMRSEPVRLLRAGGVVVAAGAFSDVPPVEADTLRRHDAVVRRIAARVDALLPSRFGSMATPEALEKMVIRRRAELHAALEQVRGKEQMTLRIFGKAGKSVRGTRPSASKAGGPGSRYLETLRTEEAATRGTVAGLEVIHALGPLVEGERIEPHRTPPLLATAYHLIPRGRSADYEEIVRASPETPFRAVASGPAPPYAFAGEVLA